MAGPKRRVQTVLFAGTLAALVLIACITIGLQIRQESLNQQLIAAVDRNDSAGVRRLLHQGSDPNTPIREVGENEVDVNRNEVHCRRP